MQTAGDRRRRALTLVKGVKSATNSEAYATCFQNKSGAASWSSRPCSAAGAPSHVFIRTLQHTGHPDPVLMSVLTIFEGEFQAVSDGMVGGEQIGRASCRERV